MRKASHEDDDGRKETNKTLAKMEKEVNAVYTQAWKEVNTKFEDFCEKFKKKDKLMRQKLASGLITKSDYIEWYKRQTFQKKSWQALLESLETDLNNADKYASAIIKNNLPTVFAQAHNFGTYEVEKGSGINTFYKLYNTDTVKRLIKDKPDLLPALNPKSKTAEDIREGKVKRWNHQKITSAVNQGILQGESIPQISKRLQEVTDMDRKAAIRNARTATTGAEAAGRDASYERAEKKGIKVKRQWLAYLDNRTRDTHAILDGQIRAVGEKFQVYGEEIMYPGDPTAPAGLVYNCRCRTIAIIEGFEGDIREGRSSKLGDMTYDEWKQAHTEHYEEYLKRKAARDAQKGGS